jgi:Putative transposase, YhgA-like
MDYIDHDELFKKLLTTFFVEFVELFLPEMANYLDREEIAFLPQEYFGDVQMGDRCKNDVLAQVKIQGQEACVLVHIENQPYRQETFDRWMFGYFLELYQKSLLPVYPIAVFSFDAPLHPPSPPIEMSCSDFKVLEFNFDSIQLNNLSWRDFLQHQNPIAVALMSRMQVAQEDRPKVRAECLRLLATLQLDPARTALISGFVDTYLNLTAAEEDIFREELNKVGMADF